MKSGSVRHFLTGHEEEPQVRFNGDLTRPFALNFGRAVAS